MQEKEAAPSNYPKTWDDGADDPWLVFHTSGTTGLSILDYSASTHADRLGRKSQAYYLHTTNDGDRRQIGGVVRRRTVYVSSICPSKMVYTSSSSTCTPSSLKFHSKPSWKCLQAIGTVLTLALTTFLHTTVVIGPSTPPTPETVLNILQYGRVQGALLTPAIIEDLCHTPTGIKALRNLEYVHYAGAPLAPKAGNQLIPHVPVVCAIGSTESGAYPTALHSRREAWDYVRFQKNAGVVFEHRFNNLYELVFVRKPACALQPVFMVYRDRDRFETNDLWVEHPVYKGLWKIVGRTDDYVAFSHADGIHASSLEPEIEAHPDVKAALIGGNGRPAPVLLVELLPGLRVDGDGGQIMRSLQPYLDRVNGRSHECVHLSIDRVIFATEKKPFVRTVKGSVARLQTLDLYRDEIAALF